MSQHPFEQAIAHIDDKTYFQLRVVAKEKLDLMPYAMRVLLESIVRNCDNFEVTMDDANKLLSLIDASSDKNHQQVEIPFKPARVLLQDFTGVPAIVDLAVMREAMISLGGKADQVNPLVPVDLVIDHSVAVDHFGIEDALQKNEDLEFERNHERFALLKWTQKAFQNMRVLPPGSGICHQLNLEYLANLVCTNENNTVLFPDSVVGTDSHTTMIAGAGILGWGVGGIEAEAVMMGQPIYMLIPEVIEFQFSGKLKEGVTSTDLVLKIAEILRSYNVVGKIVEFTNYHDLSVADRALISNMSPEFGCTAAYFPPDDLTLAYMEATGRDPQSVSLMSRYLKANDLLRTPDSPTPVYNHTITLDLSSIEPALAGPKRPHDCNLVKDMWKTFTDQLKAPIGFRGFGLTLEALDKKVPITVKQHTCVLKHGSVVLAAITSCTNTSNPSVVIGAGLLAQNAVKYGLKQQPYVKCSLSPGSHVVQEYLVRGGLYESMKQLGFYLTGYGCQTCIGNSGDLYPTVSDAISAHDLVAVGVLSGNRNFEGRINPSTRANFLASPPLVVAYALAGRIDFCWETEPLGQFEGRDIFLRDIWPSSQEIEEYTNKMVTRELFQEVYGKITQGSTLWRDLPVSDELMCRWDPKSTYIHRPPFFDGLTKEPLAVPAITNAHCLLLLGDSITTDHISPAGKIALNSPAASYLSGRGVTPKFFNSYGSRRGNDEVMVRGTFANIRLVNKLVEKTGPFTLHVPSGEIGSVYDVSQKYQAANIPTIIIAGAEYGSGSSRDWAAKGVKLLGVRAIIAKSYERIHRSNLVGMGILPLEFVNSEDAQSLNLNGKELYTINPQTAGCQNEMEVIVTDSAHTLIKKIKVKCRIDTPVELDYYKHGGILNCVLRKMASKN